MVTENRQHRLLISGSSAEFIPLVQYARARGIYTIVCDGYPDGPAKKIADKSYDVDVRNTEKTAEICRENGVDGIIGSFSDVLFEEITKIADLAGLRWYAKPDKLDFYREKDKAKALLAKLGIRVPKNTQLHSDFSDRELDGFSFPLVIKPVNGYGSKGIFVVHSISEIRDRFSQVATRSFGEREIIQVEEYSAGYEYNIMTWLVDGKVYPLGFADRERNPQSGSAIPQMNRIVYPSVNSATVLEKAVDVLQKFADAVGQTEGALSMQFFYHEDEVEVCEIAGRLFGQEHELITYNSGLDVIDLLLDYVYDPDAVKNTLVNHSLQNSRYCAGLYFVGIHGKTIENQNAVRELAKDPHTLKSILFYEDGETVGQYSNKPYLVRFCIGANTRRELADTTKMFYEKMYVPAVGGGRVDMPFVLEERIEI